MVTVTGDLEFFFPKGTFTELVRLDAQSGPISMTPEVPLLSTGVQVDLVIVEGQTQPFQKPFRVTAYYDDQYLKHFDENTLSIYLNDPKHRSEPISTKRLKTMLDIKKNIATAEAATAGEFALFGVLICPNDIREEDDIAPMGRVNDISFNLPQQALFDIAEDIDFYFIEINQNKKYSVQTINSKQGVIPIIELFSSRDEIDFKQGNRQTPQERIEINPNLYLNNSVFIRITPDSKSRSGCDATYELLVREY